jgi:hypothetical protein
MSLAFLNQGERRRPVRSHTGQFTVEIRAIDWQRTQCLGSARILFCPVEAGAGEQCHDLQRVRHSKRAANQC